MEPRGKLEQTANSSFVPMPDCLSRRRKENDSLSTNGNSVPNRPDFVTDPIRELSRSDPFGRMSSIRSDLAAARSKFDPIRGSIRSVRNAVFMEMTNRAKYWDEISTKGGDKMTKRNICVSTRDLTGDLMPVECSLSLSHVFFSNIRRSV